MKTSVPRARLRSTGDNTRGKNGHSGTTHPVRWLNPIWSLAVASFFSPVLVWIHSSERAGITGYVLIAACLLGSGIVIQRLMTTAGLDPEGSTLAVATLIIAATNAGLVLESYDRLVVLAGTLGFVVMAYRLRDFGPWRVVVTWGLIALATYPVLVAVSSQASAAPPTMGEPAPIDAGFTAEKRDLVILVIDGYANAAVLAEMYGIDTGTFEATLGSKGFDVDRDTVANYGRTRFSVASVLQLVYPVTEGTLTAGDLDWLLDVIGGDHRLGDWLKENGYRHVYVESGWFGTRCRDTVDVCVEGPWPDESLYDFTSRTIVRDLPGVETGRSFTRGTLAVIEWLETDLSGVLGDDVPDLVFAHLLAPHPPLFLDESCVMRAQEGFKGFTIAQPGMTSAELAQAREWYGRQVSCVNEVLADVAEIAERSDSMVVMFGDHGPDSLGQLYVHGAEWDENQRFERFGAMYAARVPGCDMSDVGSLVNAGRRLVACLSDGEFPDLPTSTYESEFTGTGEKIVEVPTPVYGDG